MSHMLQKVNFFGFSEADIVLAHLQCKKAKMFLFILRAAVLPALIRQIPDQEY
jgi:hypothetical protein